MALLLYGAGLRLLECVRSPADRIGLDPPPPCPLPLPRYTGMPIPPRPAARRHPTTHHLGYP